MPSRKQRRRRQKERRHEYEFVYVDEEGREVEVDSSEVGRSPRREVRRNGTKDARTKKGARPVRKIDPPSWKRVARREEEKDPGAPLARHRTSLVGLEREECSRLSLERLAAGSDSDASVEDEHKRVLLDLVLTELLAWIEPDQDCAGGLVRVEDDG